ncbi:MAG: CBS domain-containing protein [Caulobacteraceae bacterium]|nr:CBS domain-containing protein [Caulobacteraceae bacterium]
MLVAQILKDKGDQVFTCKPGDTVAEAARALHEQRVGALVVRDQDRVVGILSERDVVAAVAADGAGALGQPVSSYMTRDVLFARPADAVDSLMERMTERRIRHLPVLNDTGLAGIVSIGDVVKCKIADTVIEAESLKAYIVSG